MLGLVLADLRRHAAGVLAIALIVALASALGVTVTLSERALRLGSARAAAAFDLVVGAPGSETQLVLSAVFLQPAPLPLLPGHVLAELRADPRVAFAAPVGFGDFVGDDPIVGTTADVVAGLGRIAEGRAFERMDEAVAGAAVDRPLGSTFTPLHGRAAEGGHPHARIAYRIVGRMAPTGTPWDRAVLVPIQAVWKAHEHEANETPPLLASAHPTPAHADDPVPDAPLDAALLADPAAPGVPAILVKPKTIADAYKLRQQYRGDRSLAVFPAEVLTRLYGTLGDARSILAAVAAGAQGLVAAAILLTVVAHVLGRRRQIGALRAFGAPRGIVFAVVWVEVFAVVGTGILAGFGLGRAAAGFLARIGGTASGVALPVEFHREDIWSLLALLAVSGVATLVPALLAYRQSPADALRG
ncbi:FtsX-like permease family protein [Aureimonas leprariae]|uniref:FtsX-like permease family protein n=1 Tax=Plantimonas leprariae TaxID=2615207 RepID=A0A7V7TX14_9HYPH|nr:FtsX-like permease family protein [Aureimonas leprariae]KAB0680200.1 FtsX-like permease family protein [Aureimonas leprariae]